MRPEVKLLPMPRTNFNSYVPHAPDEHWRGSVLSIYGSNSVAYAPRNNVIAINRGAQDGMEVGTVLKRISKGNRIVDKTSATRAVVTLPDESNGYAMVFKVFDRVSYVLITTALRGVKVGDTLTEPQAR